MFIDTEIPPEMQCKYRRVGGEFVCLEEINEESQSIQQRTAEQKVFNDQQIIEHVSDEDGTQQLLRFIKSIPKIKFKLTAEQDLMIGTPENLLCLGRSGTGKTTSSALRLFASDAFYKFHEQL